MSSTSETIGKSSTSIFDMILQMQQIGLRAMTAYEPFAFAYLDSANAARSSGFSATRGRTTRTLATNEEQVIGLGEEVLNVGTRMVQGKTTKVRRVVVETPVQQEVTLHSETVVVERRRPVTTTAGDVLTEITVEMADFNEVPVVSKAVHLVEEVLLRKETTARTETIHDTVKRDKLEIDQPSSLPVVFNQAKKQDEKKRADESQDKKQAIVPVQPEGKAGDQKLP